MTKKTYKRLSITFLVLIGASIIFMLRDDIPTNDTPKTGETTKTETTKAIPVRKSYTGLINDASNLIEKQLYTQAANNLSQAISQKPKNIDPYLLLGDIYIRTQENEKLSGLVLEIGKRFPSHTGSSTLETRRLIMNQEYQAALSSFEANKDILTPELSFYYATLLALQNDHEQAQEILDTINAYKVSDELEVTETENPTISSDLEAKTEALLKVYKDFSNVNDGKNPHLFALLAKTLAEHNEVHLAKEFAQNAIKEDPSYIDAWVLRGYTSLILGEHESALKDLQYAYEIAPERTNTHYFLALAYMETGELEKSALFFEKVLNTDFEFAEEVEWKLIELYTKQKKYDEVLSLYEKILINSKNPKDYVNPLQMAIEVLNKPETALKLTSDLIRKSPDNFIGYNFHAWALIANKQYYEAEETLQKALEIKPNNPGSYLYLGLLYEEQQKFSEALEYYKKSYDAGKDGPELGITQLAAEKHNQLAERNNRPNEPQAEARSGNSP